VEDVVAGEARQARQAKKVVKIGRAVKIKVAKKSRPTRA